MHRLRDKEVPQGHNQQYVIFVCVCFTGQRVTLNGKEIVGHLMKYAQLLSCQVFVRKLATVFIFVPLVH